MSVGVTSNIYGNCKYSAYKVTATLKLLLTGAHTLCEQVLYYSLNTLRTGDADLRF